LLPPPGGILTSSGGNKSVCSKLYLTDTLPDDSENDGYDTVTSDLMLYVEAMHSQPKMLCGRAVIAQQYGQELYLSDFSEE